VVCAPARVLRPVREAELVEAVGAAGRAGRRVRPAGAGHSFSSAAATDGVLLDLRDYARVLHVDRERARVTVEAGIRLRDLSRALDAAGLALPNLGDIDRQGLAGAVATGTHGTGARFASLAGPVVGIRLVTGAGEVVAIDEGTPELLNAARVSLGALGVVSTLTLQCVPRFRLRAREAPERLEALLPRLEAEVEANDHFELFWVPHTGWALTKRLARTRERPMPRPAWRALRDDVLYANALFGLACRLGALRPEWIPALVRRVPGPGPVEYTDASWRVFPSPRWVPFVETEWALPRAAAAEALARVRDWVRSSGARIDFPVELRFSAAEDALLAPAHGRDTAWLACHLSAHRGRGAWEPFFRAVQAIARDYDGRPHWGKLHFENAGTLAPRYPGWESFRKVRERLDPERRFANAYTERVLGP